MAQAVVALEPMTMTAATFDAGIPRIAFIGPYGVGKSTAIRAVSDISVLGSEAGISQGRGEAGHGSDKHLTTVGLEYGEIRLSAQERFALFGLPGQDRFEHMWRMVLPGAMGVLLLLHAADPLDVFRVWLDRVATHAPGGNLVVGVTRAQAEGESALQRYRTLLTRHGARAAAFTLDPRVADDVRCAVMTLAAMQSTKLRYPAVNA